MYNKWKQSNLVNRYLQSTLKSVNKKTKQSGNIKLSHSRADQVNHFLRTSAEKTQLTKRTDSRSRSTLLGNSTNGWHARKGRGALFTPDFSLALQLPEDHASAAAHAPSRRLHVGKAIHRILRVAAGECGIQEAAVGGCHVLEAKVVGHATV
jgi:hypothetical protein